MLLAVVSLAIDGSGQTPTKARRFTPDHLFRVRRVGAVAWSPDGRFAAIEFSKDSNWLGSDSVPNNDLSLLDVEKRSLRALSPKAGAFLGFFNAVWSPDSRRVAFLSIDNDAVVRVWVWTVGTRGPVMLPNVEVRSGDSPFAWIDGDRLAVMAWERGAIRSGLLYTRVLKGQNVVTNWQRARDEKVASVSVVQSRSSTPPTNPGVELLTINLRSGLRKTLARGRLHMLKVSPDGCCVSFLRHNPGVPGQPVASYFEVVSRGGDVDAGYTAVTSGTERHVVDALTGAEITKPAEPIASKPQTKPVPPTPPRSDARLLSQAPLGNVALYIANGADGSHLWLSEGAPNASVEIWRANEWMSTVKLGRAERLSYTATDGTPLNAWLLLPPDYVAGTRVPVVTIVYPTSVYGSNEPSSFSPYRANFEHPQLFAALGYGVLLVSMPETSDPTQSHALPPLLNGVIPALDAAIARGVADPDRIAVMGQSDGGFAVLGLITQTNRFRSAIASAAFSNFLSLYGTFYGQYRHGDAGVPEAGQVLRMLQLEKGAMGLGGPPWIEPNRYRENSAINHVDKVQTPLMLVHGELDFIPIQQSEEFFTALFRQDKRAQLVRYAGEGHTIAGKPNVLDLWRRIESWLEETMAPRK